MDRAFRLDEKKGFATSLSSSEAVAAVQRSHFEAEAQPLLLQTPSQDNLDRHDCLEKNGRCNATMPNATARYLPEGLLNDEVCPAHNFLHYSKLRVCC